MKTDRYGKVIVCLTGKQMTQLTNISAKAQPYLPFEEVVFAQLLKLAFTFIRSWMNAESFFRKDLAKFNDKYYSRGFKVNTHELTGYQLSELFALFLRPRIIEFMKPYQPIERDAFVMTFRAYKRYMITGRTKESEDILLEKLKEIKNLLN